MRIRQRLVSLLLAGALLLPGLPAARALPFGSETGSVSATLRIDYPQSLEALQDRDIQAELFQDGRSLGTIPLTEEDESALLGGYPAAVSLRNPDGGALSGGILENYAVAEIMKSYAADRNGCRFWYYRDKEGKEIDLILERDGWLCPLEVKRSANPELKGIRVFSILDKASLPRERGGVLCLRADLSAFNSNDLMIPIWMI